MTNEDLAAEIKLLKGRLDAYELSDRFLFFKLLQMADGRNIQLGRTTGTMIGTAADQKLGFFGHAPAAQQSHISTPGGGSTVDSQSRTAINAIISVLEAFGLTS